MDVSAPTERSQDVEGIFLNIFRLKGMFVQLTPDDDGLPGLPQELAKMIIEYALIAELEDSKPKAYTVLPLRGNGTPIMDSIPEELRRNIYQNILPDFPAVITPKAPRDEAARNHADLQYKMYGKTRNAMIDLMLVNKRICHEVAAKVYNEQTFRVDVYQGKGTDGGVEFISAGRQQLFYQLDITDGRFAKFSGEDKYGFARLKKVEILIFPRQERHKHLVLNTYYMVQALARLLQRTADKKQRLNQLTVRFHDPPDTAPLQDTWFDIRSGQPRSTSIHGMSDIELVLRPLASLSHVQSVLIELPLRLRRHQATCAFTNRLESHVLGNGVALFDDGVLDQRLEASRQALEDWICDRGVGAMSAPGNALTDAELEVEEEEEVKEEVLTWGREENWADFVARVTG